MVGQKSRTKRARHGADVDFNPSVDIFPENIIFPVGKFFHAKYESNEKPYCGPTAACNAMGMFSTDGMNMCVCQFHGHHATLENIDDGNVDVDQIYTFLAQTGFILGPKNGLIVGGEGLTSNVSNRTLQPGEFIYKTYQGIENERDNFLNLIAANTTNEIAPFFLLYLDILKMNGEGEISIVSHHIAVVRRGPSWLLHDGVKGARIYRFAHGVNGEHLAKGFFTDVGRQRILHCVSKGWPNSSVTFHQNELGHNSHILSVPMVQERGPLDLNNIPDDHIKRETPWMHISSRNSNFTCDHAYMIVRDNDTSGVIQDIAFDEVIPGQGGLLD